MEKNKLDQIYALSYENQIIYYFDDVLFQDDKEDLNMDFDVPRISELSRYISEFTESFLNSSHFSDFGVVHINCGLKEYEKGKTPRINNNDKSSIYLTERRDSSSTVTGEDKIIIKYTIEVDISKDFSLISSDLNILIKTNPFFDFFNLMEESLGIKNIDQFSVLINSARIDLLLEMKWSFMVIEYCHLRKFAFLSKERALSAIKIIYEKEKVIK